MTRKINIITDGDKLASLRYREAKTINLPIGAHNFIAKMGWCKSEPFSINLSESDSKTLLIDCISPLEAGIRAWIPPFVIFTIRELPIPN